MSQRMIYGISFQEKMIMMNECFDLYVKFKDFLLHHMRLTKLKETVREKLHEFLMEERSGFGSHKGREVAHKYYPLLFPEVYYFTLLMYSGYKIIRDKYGIRNDFSIFTNLLMYK
jgi:hypothetical protein